METLTGPDQNLAKPEQTLAEPNQTLADPVQTLADLVQTLVYPVQTLVDPVQAADGSDQELSDAASRDYLDSLLDISEESFWTHQDYEDHWCSGWDEAVRGWSRAAPMAGAYLPQKKEHEAKKLRRSRHTKTQSQHLATVGGILKSDSEQNSSLMKSSQSPESTLTSTDRRGETITEEVKLRDSPHPSSPLLHLNRTTKQHHHRPSSVVPIKNITFSPPSESARHKAPGLSAQKVPEGEALEPESSTAEKKSGGARRVKERRAEVPSATVTTKYQKDQRSEGCWDKSTAEASQSSLHHLSSKYMLVSMKKPTSLPPLKSSPLNQQQTHRGKPASDTEGVHFEKKSGDWKDTSNHHQQKEQPVSPYEASLSSKPNAVFCAKYFTQAVPSSRATGAQTQT
ncbi:uncharacterized protein LOC143007461 [Genypterus blacodes]|uniref:uncharacterized protein LOC143007461 n=1 Tax=Genypterus blacodes TaxID=154954 RepID=UPI003F758373